MGRSAEAACSNRAGRVAGGQDASSGHRRGPRPRQDGMPACVGRPAPRGHPLGDRAELLVARAGDERHGQRRAPAGGPTATASRPCRGRGGRRRGPRPCCGGGRRRPARRRRGGAGEQRLGGPFAHEGVHADGLDAVGERVVGAPARRALRRVGQARAGRDEDERGDARARARARRGARSARPSSSRRARTAAAPARARRRPWPGRRPGGAAKAPWPGRSGATALYRPPSAASTGRQLAFVCVNPCSSTSSSARHCPRRCPQPIPPPPRRPRRPPHTGLRAFVDELVRCGLREACTSPGSRSTPLALSLVRDGRLRATSHLDERSGAFFALGLAKASGRPVALACTSGTAAANYAPAVIEAHEARVPLIVLTADRPPELRDLGAGQTIDQIKLYGSAAKWFLEVDDHPATPERAALAAPARLPRVLDGARGPARGRCTSTSRCASRSCSRAAALGRAGRRRAGRRAAVGDPPAPDGAAGAGARRRARRRVAGAAARGRGRGAGGARPGARRRRGGVRRARGRAGARRPAFARAPRACRGGAL